MLLLSLLLCEIHFLRVPVPKNLYCQHFVYGLVILRVNEAKSWRTSSYSYIQACWHVPLLISLCWACVLAVQFTMRSSGYGPCRFHLQASCTLLWLKCELSGVVCIASFMTNMVHLACCSILVSSQWVCEAFDAHVLMFLQTCFKSMCSLVNVHVSASAWHLVDDVHLLLHRGVFDLSEVRTE